METKKKNSSFVNTMAKKKKILVGTLGCLSMTSLLIGVACNGNNYTDRGENGVYYCMVDGKEYQVILSKGVATLVFDGETDSAGYEYDGETFSLTLQGEKSPLNTKFSGNTLTLEYNGSTYTYLKKVNYLVSYNVDGGSAVASDKVLNGKTLSQPESPVKDGHNFIAWYTDSAFTTPFAFDATIITSDLTLYARYVEKVVGMGEYLVSFDTLGGNTIEAKKTVSGKLYNLPVAEKEGKTFLGWWMSDTQDPNQLTCQYTGQALSANTTLYAVYESDAPAISVTDKGASWTAVGAGLSYTVTITDPMGGTTSSSSSATSYSYNFENKDPGLYKVEVKVGNTTATAYYMNKVLARVSQFSVAEPAVLIYNAVENATQYYITVDCGNDSHSHTEISNGTYTSFNFSNCEMQEGGIVFTVTATAPGWASSVSETFVYNRDLSGITELKYNDETAEITWDSVANASYYNVQVTNGGKTTKYVVGDEKKFSLESFTGETTIKVTPFARGYNIPEAAEMTKTFDRLTTPTNIKQYASNAGEKLTWDAVEGATGYKIKIGSSVYETTETSYSIPDSFLTAGTTYEVSIMAVGATEATNSLWSKSASAAYQQITAIEYNKGILSWNLIGGAYDCAIKVNGTIVKSITDGTNSAEIALTKKGINTIEVVARSFIFEELSKVSIDVYAHEVNFDVQGGSAVEPIYVATGDPIELPTTTREHRVFSGWYNVPGGAKDNGYEYIDPIYTATNSMTLFAYWTAEPEDVTLTINEGEGTFGEGSDVIEQVTTLYYGDSYKLPVPTSSDLTKTFKGWFNKEGVQLTDYKGQSVAPWDGATDCELEAQFIEILKYTLRDDGLGYRVMKTDALNYVEEVKIPAYLPSADGTTMLPVIEIAPNAFYYCDNLKKISIPDTVQAINIGAGGPTATASAFQFCNNLKEIEVYCCDEAQHATHEVKFASEDGVLLRVVSGDDASNYGYAIHFIPAAKTGDYTVPSNVTSIPSNVFNKAKFNKVTIPASVISVGNNAFTGSKISEIVFEDPTSDKANIAIDFGSNVFSNNANLETITFPAREMTFNGDESFDREIFSNCMALSEIKMAEGGNYKSFNGMLCDLVGNDLRIVYCPVGFTGDANGIYDIPVAVSKIGEGAFAECRRIKGIVINEYINEIAANAFENCTSLENITFKGGMDDDKLAIGASAFKGCISLTEIELPQNLSSVGTNAFAGTKNLTTVYFNCNGEVTFANNAFSDGSKGYVTTVKLGKDVNTISNFANVFANCKIEKFEVEAGSTSYYCDNFGVLYNKDATTLLYVPYVTINDGETANAYSIPTTVKTISTSAFAARTGLKAIEIPANVTAIGNDAFSGCTSLTTLTFKARTEDLTINSNAFKGCSALTSVDLVSGITSVGANAFANCTKLSTFKMSETVTAITPSSALSGCNALATVTIASGNTAFASVNNVIYGKEGGVIKTLEVAANMAGEVEIPATVTSIAANAFSNKTGITKVTFLHDGTVSVTFGANAFKNATGIQEITLPTGTKEITNSMFSGCTKLRKITIPGTVELIENLAFENCSSLSELNFLPGTANLVIEDARSSEYNVAASNSPFKGCNALQTVILPERTTKIGAYAFYQLTGLKKIVIPSTVEIIGTLRVLANGSSNFGNSSVFSNCTNLEEVIFAVNSEEYNPNGTLVSKLTHIGGNAFSYCSKLRSIDMPDSVEYLGSQVFMSCTSLTKAKLSHGITNLLSYTYQELGGTHTGSGALANLFNGCTVLTDVTLPRNLTAIGDRAFNNCKALTHIDLPETLTAIGKQMFTNCTGLASIEIPASVKTISDNGFSSSGLVSITIPNTVTSVGNNAFNGCTKLTNVTFEDGGALIVGNLAFKGCTALNNVALSESVKALGTQSFQDCTALETITIPASITNEVTKLYHVFDGCIALKTMIVDSTSKIDVDLDNGLVLGISNGTIYFALNSGNNSDGIVDIPDGVKAIEHFAFYNLSWVKEVNIPASVTRIGESAFNYCSNLTTVNFLPKADGTYGIQNIATEAFRNTAIEELTVPASVTNFGQRAFVSNKLKSVTWNTTAALPAYAFQSCAALETFVFNGKVTNIGNMAFNGCTSLKSINLPDSVTTLGTNVFGSCSALETVKLPAGIKSIPNQTFNSCKALKNFTMPATVTTIGQNAFSGCSSLTSITIPQGVTTLGSQTQSSIFANCSGLTTIHLPSSLTTVGPYSFQNCTSLVSVTGGENVQGVYDQAFVGCTALKSISFPKATTLHSGMFKGCTALETVYMPMVNTVHNTGNATRPNYNSASFEGCTSLHTVTFGMIDMIPNNTFKGCVNLTNFTLPASVTMIGDYAFEGAALTEIDFNEGLTSVGLSAFYGNDFAIVNIPSTLSSIGAGAFANCQNLMEFTVDSNNVWFRTDSELAETNKAFVGSLFDKDGSLLYFPVAKDIEGGILDFTGTDITFSDYAFAGAKSLKAIKLPETMTAIPAYAFANSGLMAIEIKGNITSIGDHAFYNCADLVNLSLTDSITSIGAYAFAGCESLKTFTLPSEITTIAEGMFMNSGLTSFNFDGITRINDYAFSNTKLTSVDLSKGTTYVASYAFYDNILLTQLTLPANNLTAEGYAFAKTGITTLIIPNGFTVPRGGDGHGSVGDAIESKNVFGDNIYLKEVTFLGTASLQVDTFKGCIALEKVTFSSGVTTLTAGTFGGCTSLTEIVLPSTITSISAGAFEGWTPEQKIYVSISKAQAASKYTAGWSGNATVYYYSETQSGGCWYYDEDGKIAIWAGSSSDDSTDTPNTGDNTDTPGTGGSGSETPGGSGSETPGGSGSETPGGSAGGSAGERPGTGGSAGERPSTGTLG